MVIMTIQENIKIIEKLSLIARKHLIGGRLQIDADYILFTFHCAHEGLDGVRVSLAKGKINALELLIAKLDKLYNREFGWSTNHTVLDSLTN